MSDGDDLQCLCRVGQESNSRTSTASSSSYCKCVGKEEKSGISDEGEVIGRSNNTEKYMEMWPPGTGETLRTIKKWQVEEDEEGCESDRGMLKKEGSWDSDSDEAIDFVLGSKESNEKEHRETYRVVGKSRKRIDCRIHEDDSGKGVVDDEEGCEGKFEEEEGSIGSSDDVLGRRIEEDDGSLVSGGRTMEEDDLTKVTNSSLDDETDDDDEVTVDRRLKRWDEDLAPSVCRCSTDEPLITKPSLHSYSEVGGGELGQERGKAILTEGPGGGARVRSGRPWNQRPFKMEASSAILRRRRQYEIDRQNMIILRKLREVKPVVVLPKEK